MNKPTTRLGHTSKPCAFYPNSARLRLLQPPSLTLCAVLLGSISVALFWWGGVFGTGDGSMPVEAKAVAAYFCFLLAYLPATLHFIVERTETSFDRVLPALQSVLSKLPDTPAQLRRSIRHKSPKWVVINLALGVSLWLVQS